MYLVITEYAAFKRKNMIMCFYFSFYEIILFLEPLQDQHNYPAGDKTFFFNMLYIARLCFKKFAICLPQVYFHRYLADGTPVESFFTFAYIKKWPSYRMYKKKGRDATQV